MTDEYELLRQYYAEFDRIGISEDARGYFGVGSSLEGAIQDLRTFATGLGTDAFWRQTAGVDFATWLRNLEAEMAANRDAT